MIIVPAFAEGQERDPQTVTRIVFCLEAARALLGLARDIKRINVAGEAKTASNSAGGELKTAA